VRFLEMLRQVGLLGGDEVAELAVELLVHRLRVVLDDVTGERVLRDGTIQTLLALMRRHLVSILGKRFGAIFEDKT
jgi:hypothetical protein